MRGGSALTTYGLTVERRKNYPIEHERRKTIINNASRIDMRLRYHGTDKYHNYVYVDQQVYMLLFSRLIIRHFPVYEMK